MNPDWNIFIATTIGFWVGFVAGAFTLHRIWKSAMQQAFDEHDDMESEVPH